MGLIDRLVLINQGKGGDFKINENGVMRFCDKVCVLDMLELKNSILEEGHMSGLSIPLGAPKMFQDLKKMFWRQRIKKEVSKFFYACLTF